MKEARIYLGKIITALANGAAVVLQESDRTVISKIRDVFRNSTFSISTHILNLGINLVIAILLARWLGPKALGQYALSTSLAGIIFGIANFGLQGILTREVAKNKENAQKYLGNTLGIRLLISIPAGIGLSYIIALALGFRGETLTLVLLAAVFVGISGLVTVFYGVFQAVGKFEDQFLFNLFYKVGSLMGCFFLLEKGFGLSSIFILFACLQAITGILSAIKISRTICLVKLNINWRFWCDFIRESFPLSLAGTAEFVNLKSDAVILGKFKGEMATGIYNGAYNLYLGATAPLYAFIVAFYPTFSHAYATSKHQAARLFKNTFILTAAVSCVLGLFLALFSNQAVVLIYGQEFAKSAIPFVILSCGLPFIILNRLNNYVLVAMGLQKWIFYIISSGAVFNVIANILLIPQYSYIGASITTIITEGLVFFAGIWMIRVRLKKDREELDVV
jgi:O-antigen/teichoic acid export membrane protein